MMKWWYAFVGLWGEFGLFLNSALRTFSSTSAFLIGEGHLPYGAISSHLVWFVSGPSTSHLSWFSLHMHVQIPLLHHLQVVIILWDVIVSWILLLWLVWLWLVCVIKWWRVKLGNRWGKLLGFGQNASEIIP